MIAATPKRHSATSILISTVIRGFMTDPPDYARAAREGCDKRPIERISRRSWKHRPSCGVLGTPWEALRGFLYVSRPAAKVSRPAVSTFWRRKPGYRMVGAEGHSSTPSGRADAENTALTGRESNPAGRCRGGWLDG